MTFQERAHKVITDAIQKYNLAVEGLTEEQFVNALKQAINCGDFKRLVRQGDNAQQIIYIPFEREQALISRIRKLEEFIDSCGTDPDTIE